LLDERIEAGCYFEAVEKCFFVDSGLYPERNGDGIGRQIDGGVGAGTVFKREPDYMAPVTAHYGYNNVQQYDKDAVKAPASLIGGCTLEDADKIIFIDELDPVDNVNERLMATEKYRDPVQRLVTPEVQWQGDGVVQVDMMIPAPIREAQYAAIIFGEKMNLEDVEVIHTEVLHPSEGTRVQIKGVLKVDLDLSTLVIPELPEVLDDDAIRAFFDEHDVKVVAGTVGEDEHSVGLREIIDIKHGGIEKYGCDVTYLGTSVPVEKLVDAAIEINASVILASTIISHDDIHYKNMSRLHAYATEKGVRDRLILCAGGTQVTPDRARENGMDEGFGRYDRGAEVATFMVKAIKEKKG